MKFTLIVIATLYYSDGRAANQPQQEIAFPTAEACEAMRTALLTRNWDNPFPLPSDPEAAAAYTFSRYRTSDCTEKKEEAKKDEQPQEPAAK